MLFAAAFPIILAYDSEVIGTYRQGKWGALTSAPAVARSGIPALRVGIGQVGFPQTISQINKTQNKGFELVFSQEKHYEAPLMTVTGGVASIKTKVFQKRSTDPKIIALITNYLKSKKFPGKVEKVYMMRGEIDRSPGFDTIFVAESRVDLGVEKYRAGDFSVLLYQSGSGSLTPLLENFYRAPGKQRKDLGLGIEVLAFADLDGVGRSEMVIEESNFLGYQIHIYGFNGPRPNRLLTYTNRP